MSNNLTLHYSRATGFVALPARVACAKQLANNVSRHPWCSLRDECAHPPQLSLSAWEILVSEIRNDGKLRMDISGL